MISRRLAMVRRRLATAWRRLVTAFPPAWRRLGDRAFYLLTLNSLRKASLEHIKGFGG